MRLIVLTTSRYENAADARSDGLLVECAQSRGASGAIVRAESMDPSGRDLARWVAPGDAVLPRGDLRSVEDLDAFAVLVRAAERAGARCLPSSEGLVAAEDKRVTQERLAGADVPIAPAALVGDAPVAGEDGRRTAARLADEVGGFPVVAKPCVGWGGQGLRCCDDADALTRALRASRYGEGPEMFVQRFVPHERALTVLVAGGRALSAWELRTMPGAAHSNCPLDAEMTKAAVRATAACGLAFASVDFLDEGDGRPLLCVDVNSMPGLWPGDPDDRAFADAIIACAMEGR